MDRRFIIERQGKSFVLYAGLLDAAHTQGLKLIRTRLIQVPMEENNQTAIVSAEVETAKGVFSGIGDASPANVSRAMLTCTIRLAETRAKARALRDAINVEVSSLEELDGDSEQQDAQVAHQVQPSRAAAPPPSPRPSGEQPKPTPAAATVKRTVDLEAELFPDNRPATAGGSTPSATATDAQIRAIYSIAEQHGIAREDLEKWTIRHFSKTVKDLTRKEASETITALKASNADPAAGAH